MAMALPLNLTTQTMDAAQKERIVLFFVSLPIPYGFWAALATLACICQGKRYGASSVRHEVQVAARFLRSAPRCIVDLGANIGNYTQA